LPKTEEEKSKANHSSTCLSECLIRVGLVRKKATQALYLIDPSYCKFATDENVVGVKGMCHEERYREKSGELL
jgi:hypothetical protein